MSVVAVAPLGSVVDTEALLDTVIASLVAGVGITVIASLAIFGFATSAQMRREGRGGPAALAGALAVLASAVFAATIAIGLVVMVAG